MIASSSEYRYFFGEGITDRRIENAQPEGSGVADFEVRFAQLQLLLALLLDLLFMVRTVTTTGRILCKGMEAYPDD